MTDIKTQQEDYELTSEEREKVAAELLDLNKDVKEIKVLNQVLSEDHESESGEFVKANIVTNIETGEQTILNTEAEDKSVDEKLEDLGSSISDFEFNNINIEANDIKDAFSSEDSTFGKYDISDETALELVDVVAKHKANKETKYKDLPAEIKGYIDNYMKSQGIAGFSAEANGMRNLIATSLIDEFITNIEMGKFNDELQSGIENIFNDMSKEISPLFKDYNNSRDEYLNKLIENIEDEDKKKLAERLLDSIHDAFELSRLKQVRHKVKRFDIEKPQKQLMYISSKYMNNKYHIYDLAMVTNVLHKHLVQNKLISEDDRISAISFMVAFAKFCRNYKVENPDEHAFMYYLTYNIILLEVYKDDQYNEFAPKFLSNVMAVIDQIY